MTLEELKENHAPVGHYVAPDSWAVGNVLTQDKEGVHRLHGQLAAYAIYSVEVSGRKVHWDHWDRQGAVRVKITFMADCFDALGGTAPGEVTHGWMGFEPVA